MSKQEKVVKYDLSTRLKARVLFEIEKQPLTVIAKTLDLTPATLQNWKKEENWGAAEKSKEIEEFQI